MAATDPLTAAVARLELERAGLFAASAACPLCAELAERLEQTMEALADALIRVEGHNQEIGEALGEVTYWRQRATEAERQLPRRLRLVTPDGIA